MATDGIRHASAAPRIDLGNLSTTVGDETIDPLGGCRYTVLLQIRREHEHQLVLPHSAPPLSGYALGPTTRRSRVQPRAERSRPWLVGGLPRWTQRGAATVPTMLRHYNTRSR